MDPWIHGSMDPWIHGHMMGSRPPRELPSAIRTATAVRLKKAKTRNSLCRNQSIFGHTDLRIGVSRAKFGAESDFEVRLSAAPQKLSQNSEKLNFPTQKIFIFFCRRRKMKCRGSSEMGFDRRILPESLISGGKRPFKVLEKSLNGVFLWLNTPF